MPEPALTRARPVTPDYRTARLRAAGIALVLAAVGVGAALRGWEHKPALWGLPLWQVTYDDGFIRRGLVGAIFQGLGGGLSAAAQARAVVTIAHVLLLVLVLTFAVWIGLLAARATSTMHALALGLLALPIVGSSLFPTMAFTPGYLDVVMLIFALGSAALLARGWILAAGVIAAIAPFIHEMFVVLWVPLAVLGWAVLCRRGDRRPGLQAILGLAAPFVTTLVVVTASSASAARVEIARHVTGTSTFKLTLLHQQFTQTLSSTLSRMDHIQRAYWWPTEPFALLYFCWPAVLAAALYVTWRRAQLDRWARASLVLAVVCPWLMLIVAWDLSRLIVLSNALVLIVILGLETGIVGEPFGRIRPAALGGLAAAGVVALALPFLYANFNLYNTYHRAHGPLGWDLMPLVHPVLARMFHLA
jgi:hypothetical protein